MLNHPELLETKAWEIFYEIDDDQSGEIDPIEFYKFMQLFTTRFSLQKRSKNDIKEIFETIDLNNDGSLSFEEIKPMLTQLIKQAAKKGKDFKISKNVYSEQLVLVDNYNKLWHLIADVTAK